MISYDAGAASYDLLSGRWSRLYVPTLLAEAGLAAGHRVLDVATGTGEAATLAGSRVGATGRVIGIDVSGPMLRIAAAKVAKQPVSLILMDGQTLAFRDESFDAVVCQLGLMFLPDPATALREWMRVLRGGGRLAVCVWAAPERVPLFGILMDELSRYFPDQRAVLYQPSALADGDTLERLLAGAGLKAIRLTRETRAHRFTSFEEYWQPFEAGGGRHGQLFLRLSGAARQAVREDARKRKLAMPRAARIPRGFDGWSPRRTARRRGASGREGRADRVPVAAAGGRIGARATRARCPRGVRSIGAH